VASYRAVVAGASLGGVEALQLILRALTGRPPVPVLITQHMSARGSVLDQVLRRAGSVPVRWAADGELAQPGSIYLCPPTSVMMLDPQEPLTVRLREKVTSMGTVDELFRTAAKVAGPDLLAVVLTGMGHDGTAGARAVKEAGGTVIAQDQATSMAFSMPRSVIAARLADHILPLPKIAELLASLGHEPQWEPESAG
jgi:two-component system chemotaxis response regulator CheB